MDPSTAVCYYPRELSAVGYRSVHCRVCNRTFMSKDADSHMNGRLHRINADNYQFTDSDDDDEDFSHLPRGQALAREAVRKYPNVLELSDFNPNNVYCTVCRRDMGGGNAPAHISGAQHQAQLYQCASSSSSSDDEDFSYLPRGQALAKIAVRDYPSIFEPSAFNLLSVYCKVCLREIPGGSVDSHVNGNAHVREAGRQANTAAAMAQHGSKILAYPTLTDYNNGRGGESVLDKSKLICKLCGHQTFDGNTIMSHLRGKRHAFKHREFRLAAASEALATVTRHHGQYFGLRALDDESSLECRICEVGHMGIDAVLRHCNGLSHKSAVVHYKKEKREKLQRERDVARGRARGREARFYTRRDGGDGSKPDTNAIRSFLSQLNTNRPLGTYFLPRDYRSLCLEDFPSRNVQMAARADLYTFARCDLMASAEGFDPFDTNVLPSGLCATIHDVLGDQPFTMCREWRKLLRAILFMNEAQLMIDLRSYNKKSVEISSHRSGGGIFGFGGSYFFTVSMPGVSENRPSVLRGDIISIHEDHNVDSPDTSSTTYSAYVHHVNQDNLVFSMPRHFSSIDPRKAYSLVFKVNRSQERKLHRALDTCFDEALLVAQACIAGGRLHSYTPRVSAVGVNPLIAGYGAWRTLSSLNDEQRAFIQHIHGPHRLSVLWGPPGTGKTTTLVAAIVDTIVRCGGAARLLICTPSNEAADLITERLAANDELQSYIRSGNFMLRLPSLTRNVKEIPSEVLKFCPPVEGGNITFPPKASIERHRVVITTLMTSDRLHAIGPLAMNFTHLFVDEAGHSTEQLMMVALNVAGPAAKVVLAGDHKQLGPRITVPLLIECRLHESPLLRIFNDASMWPIVGNQLLRCYRSHPAIVRLINTCYNDKLQATVGDRNTFRGLWSTSIVAKFWRMHCAEEEMDQLAAYSVPTPSQPILCINHTNRESREKDSPSWMNAFEVTTVGDIVFQLWDNKLISSFADVAVITPYRKQVQKLEDHFYGRMINNYSYSNQMIWNDPRTGEALRRPRSPVKVATVDSFQGREAKVVIVSCVRSNMNAGAEDSRFGLGFLSQPERANVSLSRAKDLLVIVGNRHVLSTDGTWRSYFKRLDAMDEGVVLNVGGPPVEGAVAVAAESAPDDGHEALLEEAGGAVRDE